MQGTPVDELDRFLASCLATPLDAAPRLILADYLESDGGKDFSLDEYQCAALRLPKGRWLVDEDGELEWRFRPWQLADLGPYTAYRYMPEVGVSLGRVRTEDCPKCAECGVYRMLYFRRKRWVCEDCRPVREFAPKRGGKSRAGGRSGFGYY